MSKSRFRRLATWIFGSISFALLIGIFLFGPRELPQYKHQLLSYFSALLAGLFGYFMTGSIGLVAETNLPKFGKVTIQACGGMALFVFVLLIWSTDLAPRVRTLEGELSRLRVKRQEIEVTLNSLENELDREKMRANLLAIGAAEARAVIVIKVPKNPEISALTDRLKRLINGFISEVGERISKEDDFLIRLAEATVAISEERYSESIELVTEEDTKLEINAAKRKIDRAIKTIQIRADSFLGLGRSEEALGQYLRI